AQKMQKRVAKVGLDWPIVTDVAQKVAEEVAELQAAAAAGDTEAMAAEFGDVLFTLVNLARHTGIDADAALRATNAKFAARVRHIEASARAEGLAVEGFDAAEWDRRWEAAKRALGRKVAA
ncbi:MAG: MazG nucleotide pyrophosphohydrolase domain-containing protein, partial [Pseudomonadota bacterium]